MRAVLRSSAAWLGCVSEDAFDLRLSRARTGVVSNEAHPVYSPVIARWTVERISEKQYILCVGLIKERIFVQFEVSNCCSDVQKALFGHESP